MECLNLMRKVHKSKIFWIPCGKCVHCNINRQNEWVFRLEQENKNSKNSAFVTLTYNDENVPKTINKDTGEVINTLQYSDVQKFIKRLRKLQRAKLKHYTVGEYGDKTQRPHYHQIVFNTEIENIQKAWGLGFVKVGTTTNASIRYVTKYMGKRVENTPDGAEKPKNVMSQGLGQCYLTDETIRHHKENLIDTIINDGGKRVALPRYFKDKIFSDYDKLRIQAINEAKHNKDLEYLWQSCTTPEKLYFEIQKIAQEKAEVAKHSEYLKQKQSKSSII